MPTQLDDLYEFYHDSREDYDDEFIEAHEKHHKLFKSYMYGALVIVLVILILVLIKVLKRFIKKKNEKSKKQN